MISKPHFLDTSADLVAQGVAMGLAPDRAKHDSFVRVEPRSGFPFNAHERLQTNVYARNMTVLNSPVFGKLRSGIWPLVWLDENFELSEEDAEDFREMRKAEELAHVLVIVGIIAGVVFAFVAIAAIVVAVKKGKNDRTVPDEEDGGYRTIE